MSIGCSDVCEEIHHQLKSLGFAIDPNDEDHGDMMAALDQVQVVRKRCRACHHAICVCVPVDDQG